MDEAQMNYEMQQANNTTYMAESVNLFHRLNVSDYLSVSYFMICFSILNQSRVIMMGHLLIVKETAWGSLLIWIVILIDLNMCKREDIIQILLLIMLHSKKM